MDRFDKVYLASIATVSTASYSLFMMNDNLEESEDEANEFTTAYVTNRALLEVPSRMKGFVEVTVQSCSEGEFQEDFRMSKPQFNWLLQEVSPLLSSPRMTGRQTDNKMGILLAVLWLLANQESYRSVANRFDMSKSDLFDAFFRVINALNILAPKIITWPDEARRRCIEKGFSKASAISGVVGVIDGTYVPILSPRNDPQACVNRKCFYGITLQGICDHELLLTDCYTGYPSSINSSWVTKHIPSLNGVFLHTLPIEN
ncbi:putative nuclease HARBI1 isoform X2 [Diachasma alloeum]|uniref:putative nuclease HARBI1 isoform X2 n=1 Tax=Diachasma alloeum TaxID=454923 RepID=UPI0007382206|nr:putative nuclease HARBI1 isoform X2 [Diachasma alloeum]